MLKKTKYKLMLTIRGITVTISSIRIIYKLSIGGLRWRK